MPKNNRKRTPAEIRAYWKGYGAGLMGVRFTGQDFDLLVDPYFGTKKDNDLLQKSLLNGLSQGLLARKQKLNARKGRRY